MASPNTSTTRRVLGDINTNIHTSALDIKHAPSVANLQRVSDSERSSGASPETSQVVGNATKEFQRDREETNTKLQVGSCEEGKMDENMLSQGLNQEPGDANPTTSTHSSVAEPVRVAGKKRFLFASVDIEDSGFHTRPVSSKKRKTETRKVSTNTLDRSATLAPKCNLPPCNDTIPGKEGWTEGRSRVHDNDPGYDHGPSASLETSHSAAQTKSSSVSATRSSSFAGDAEDTATTVNNSQATETIIPDDLPFIPTTVSTTRSFRTSKSKYLTREEIRQKSQALRLRLSLANYKVKTNQIDIPLSRLEVFSTSPKHPSLTRLQANSSYSAIMGTRTPLPGASTLNGRSALIPAINLQRPSPSNRHGRAFFRDREKDRGEDVDIPSSPPLPRRYSLSRRDSGISCTSFGSNSCSGAGAGHAHPLTPNNNNKNKALEKENEREMDVEKEVARRKQEMMKEQDKENILLREPILERQKLGILNPPMMFAQPGLGAGIGMERSERGRSPELSRGAADGLVRLSLLR